MKSRSKRPFIYLLVAIISWAIVDFGTAGGFRLLYLEKYWQGLLIIYIGFPLIFTLLIYGLSFSERALLIPTLLSIIIIEVVMTHNPLIITFPSCLYGIPLAIAVYVPLVYFPLWIERGEVKKHLRIVIFLSIIIVMIMLLTTFITTKY